MSEKFERKYKRIINKRHKLIETQRDLITKINPLIKELVNVEYCTVRTWMEIIKDLHFIEAKIKTNSIDNVGLVQNLLDQCLPETKTELNDGDGFTTIDDFMRRIDEVSNQYIRKLSPIVSNEQIKELIIEIDWLSLRAMMRKLNVNSLRGSQMKQNIKVTKKGFLWRVKREEE